MSRRPFEERLKERKDSVGGDYDKALQVFLADRRRAGCTDRTVEWYEEILGGYFYDFLVEKRMPLEPAKWISNDVEDYMDYLLKERGCKPVTCKNRFSAIRAWCNFLYRKGYIETNPVADLVPMKVKKEVSKTIPDDVLDAILKKPNTATCTFAEYRDWAIVWTLFDTGIRANELVHIQLQDIHLDEGYILITHGKGQKERPVAVSKTLYRVLKEYLQIRQVDADTDERYLFCNTFGEKMNSDSVRWRLHQLGRKHGVETMALSPHKFRYTFAKHYIKNGGDPFRLQKALGHTTIEMVRNYVEMFGSDVIDAHQQFSPADNYAGASTKNSPKGHTRKRRMTLR